MSERASLAILPLVGVVESVDVVLIHVVCYTYAELTKGLIERATTSHTTRELVELEMISGWICSDRIEPRWLC